MATKPFTAKSVYDVGRLISTDFQSHIREFCFMRGYDCTIADLGGFWQKKLAITIKGNIEERLVSQLKVELENFADAWIQP